MSLPSESIRPRRRSLAWVMAVIVIIAADLAAMRAIFPRMPNPGLVIMVLVLEVGLFRMVSQRGAARAFWAGFEVAGWVYVITAELFAWTAWRLARFLFEGYVLGRPIGPPFEMQRFILFAGGLHLLISLALALLVGILTRSAWRRWGAVRGASAWRVVSGRSRPEDHVEGSDQRLRAIAVVSLRQPSAAIRNWYDSIRTGEI